MNVKSFGKNLTELRENLGLSQADFSKLVKISQPSLNMLEKGKRKPSITTIVILLKALNVKFERLLK